MATILIGDKPMTEEYDDAIAEDPDEQLEEDKMTPAEAAFTKGAEDASEGEEEKEEDEDDEVN